MEKLSRFYRLYDASLKERYGADKFDKENEENSCACKKLCISKQSGSEFIKKFSILKYPKPFSSRFHHFCKRKVFFIIVANLLFLQISNCYEMDHNQHSVHALSPKFKFLSDTKSSVKKSTPEKYFLKLADRPPSRRHPRSVLPCPPALERLSDLARHTYLMASSGYEKMHVKRHATRRLFGKSSWKTLCLRTYNQMKEVLCDTHQRIRIFHHYTDDLQESLRSIRIFLEQEMNKSNQSYTEWSRSSCDHFNEYTDHALQRRIINKLYNIDIGLKHLCLNSS